VVATTPIHLSGRGVVLDAMVGRRVEAKVAKLTRVLPKIREARVVLARQRYRHVAEVTLHAKGTTLRAEAAAADVHSAVDLALENLGQQVRRRKDRITAINAHFITAFLDRYVKGDASRDAYLNVAVSESSAGAWPAAGPALPYDAYSPGNATITVWKGFQRNHATGLELLQAGGAP